MFVSAKKLGAFALVLGALGCFIGACSSSKDTGDGGTNCGMGSTECNGTCTVLARDFENCGGCGMKCQAGQVCSAGMCSSTCSAGTTACNGSCVATMSDPMNCGACGTKCKMGEVCSSGSCASQCAMGQTQCGQSCVNPQSDNLNCGMCGNACTQGLACVAGKCTLACQAPLTKCSTAPMMPDAGMPDAAADGSSDAAMEAAPPMDASMMSDAAPLPAEICVDLQNDNNNCGGCGTVCSLGAKCVMGSCQTCNLVCNGACVDNRNDDNNCRSCGASCGNNSCKNGKCCANKVNTVYFQDDFHDTSKGWTLDQTWAIGTAKASLNCVADGQDPAQDHTQLFDNGLAGVVIGGCAGNQVHGFYYLTSPAFDTSNANKVIFSYWRHLHSDYTPYMKNQVEVYDGNTWQVVFATAGIGTNDNAWTHQQFDVTQYKNNKMQVRFGYNTAAGVFNVASWSVDDVLVADADCP